jgi:uncharacterized protein YgfB (UPF0149 family)
MSEAQLSHSELGDILDRLRVGVGASDLHGSLTGYLCGGGKAGAKAWPEALELDAAGDTWQNDAVFPSLYRQCREQLEDSDLGFEPLLPSDDTSVAKRAEALVEWCRGFLGGIGLSGAGSARGPLSAEASEIIRDFGAIAASSFDYGDDDEDETALTEVLEFVRVGVLLLHGELDDTPQRQRTATAASKRVH